MRLWEDEADELKPRGNKGLGNAILKLTVAPPL